MSALRRERDVLARMLAEGETAEAELDARLARGVGAYRELLARLGQSIEVRARA